MDYHWNYLSNPFQILQKWSLGWGNQHQTLQVVSLNDYILFPDPRVMDSMDYHWKYLSNPLKTLHDSNQECSRGSGGDSKEEDYMVLLQTQWECFRRWLKVSHLSHPWWFSHLFSHPFSHLDLLVEEAKSHQFYRFHHCQSQDFYFCKGSKEGKTLRF